MFNTYVINLEKDKKKLKIIKEKYKDVGINLIRFNAVYGKYVKDDYDNYLTNRCKYTCPNSVIGCGLSHILLSEYLYNNDNNDYTLVVEDDSFPKIKNFKNKINNIVNKAPKDWEYIMLYCQGMCNSKKQFDDDMFFRGSTAAYLINKKGQKKLKDLKLKDHIDLQIYNNSDIKVYKFNKNLFYTDESVSYNRVNSNYKILHLYDKYYNYLKLNKTKILTNEPSFFINFKTFKIPFLNIELSHFIISHIIMLIILLCIIFFMDVNYTSKFILIISVIFLFYLSVPINLLIISKLV
jgi:GR25 family glycosyltransferase involved in LPS biosynthesis